MHQTHVNVHIVCLGIGCNHGTTDFKAKLMKNCNKTFERQHSDLVA